MRFKGIFLDGHFIRKQTAVVWGLVFTGVPSGILPFALPLQVVLGYPPPTTHLPPPPLLPPPSGSRFIPEPYRAVRASTGTGTERSIIAAGWGRGELPWQGQRSSWRVVGKLDTRRVKKSLRSREDANLPQLYLINPEIKIRSNFTSSCSGCKHKQRNTARGLNSGFYKARTEKWNRTQIGSLFQRAHAQRDDRERFLPECGLTEYKKMRLMLWDRQRHLQTWAQTGKRSDTHTRGDRRRVFLNYYFTDPSRHNLWFGLSWSFAIWQYFILYYHAVFCGEVFVHWNPNQNH